MRFGGRVICWGAPHREVRHDLVQDFHDPVRRDELLMGSREVVRRTATTAPVVRGRQDSNDRMGSFQAGKKSSIRFNGPGGRREIEPEPHLRFRNRGTPAGGPREESTPGEGLHLKQSK